MSHWEVLDPWVEKVPCRSEWPSTPVFFPGEFHGQSSLTGYSPLGLSDSASLANRTNSESCFTSNQLKINLPKGSISLYLLVTDLNFLAICLFPSLKEFKVMHWDEKNYLYIYIFFHNVIAMIFILTACNFHINKQI